MFAASVNEHSVVVHCATAVATDPHAAADPPPHPPVYGAIAVFPAPEYRTTSYVTVPVPCTRGHDTTTLPDGLALSTNAYPAVKHFEAPSLVSCTTKQ